MQINKSVIHNATKEVSLPRVWVPGAQELVVARLGRKLQIGLQS